MILIRTRCELKRKKTFLNYRSVRRCAYKTSSSVTVNMCFCWQQLKYLRQNPEKRNWNQITTAWGAHQKLIFFKVTFWSATLKVLKMLPVVPEINLCFRKFLFLARFCLQRMYCESILGFFHELKVSSSFYYNYLINYYLMLNYYFSF